MDKPYTILCYGDSNTWGWVPGKLGAERFSETDRWPGVMRRALGKGFLVHEAGFGGRSTAYEDPRPEMPLRNGLQTLPMFLETFAPVDLLILMLGTTDCKEMMGLSAADIAAGMEELVSGARAFQEINGRKVGDIVVAAPVIPNDEAGIGARLFRGGTAKGRELPALYQELARSRGCHFIDVNRYVAADAGEGVHIGAADHRLLGAEMARRVLGLAAD